MITQLVTIPVVFPSGNRLLQEESEKLHKQLKELLDDNYTITHSTSATLVNTLYVSYVLQKEK